MIKKIFQLAIPLTLLLCHSASAAAEIRSKVLDVRTHEAQSHPTWSPPVFWFSLENIKQLGNCGRNAEQILFVGNDKQMLAMVLAAQLSGLDIVVAYDDTVTQNGFCKALHVTTVRS
jgi:hypothetical protein